MSKETASNLVFQINPKPIIGRAHILARLIRFALISLRNGHYDYFANAVRSVLDLLCLTAKDVFIRKYAVRCNICGWEGNSFYRHTGSGYDEIATLCPGCFCLDRHRTLLFILEKYTDLFAPGHKVVEVAPQRHLENLFLRRGVDYTSFDIKRGAMEQGDITHMHYMDNSVDYFICFHVLEHVPGEKEALREIYRVLKPNGCAVIQVPVDWNLLQSYEYPEADPRDTYHVRRYGRDLIQRIAYPNFEVISKKISDFLSDEDINRFGYSREPVFFLRKAPAI
jgi:SAM-dependent methyltransferase